MRRSNGLLCFQVGWSDKFLLAFASRVNLFFGSPWGSWLYYWSFQDLYKFWNGASTSTRREVCLILVTSSLLGVIQLNTNTHTTHTLLTHLLLMVHRLNCCWSSSGYLLCFHYILSIWYYTESIENTASNSASLVMCVLVAAGMCLRSRCQAMIRGIHRYTESKVIS
jgi:hypothetical protein